MLRLILKEALAYRLTNSDWAMIIMWCALLIALITLGLS
jgi:hypothetical protein